MQRKKPLLKYVILLSILVTGAVLSFLTAPPQQQTPYSWPTMGTVATLTFRGTNLETHELTRQQVQNLWRTLEERLSAVCATSELCRLAPLLVTNGEPALSQIPADVRPCYAFALDLQKKSAGAFSPFVGDVLNETGFTRASPFDLGGLAKGFAVDCAYETLKTGDHLLLDLGGNLRAFGGTWHTGVRNPFSADAPLAVFDLRPGEAVATSGNYERFVERDGKRLAHIFDPRTRQPVTGLAGVTVIAPTAMLADGLSTTLFVLGPEAGDRFLRRHYPGTAALWIPDTPNNPEIQATVAMSLRLRELKAPLTVIRAH